MDFIQFYINGGVFNHAITITAAIGVLALALHARALKLGQTSDDGLRVVDRLVVLCVGFGLLGTLFGSIDLAAALQTIPAADYDLGRARGMTLVVIPLAWSLMCAIPLWIASTVQSRRPARQPART
ncbi:hypothetical protein G6O69_19935 [Pseudenhygromyxa sp. WMMC2535]|uniref:hypothetical protein n=1 Tax=Pseudenhygromyxa sp. WMMC2535 TaxID=2712867 RepID=UPI001553BA15|nr:hypothetical protein [Pseudenhygromyxa sp. WMMC2535]NVB40127.1 hypothetical protein [Pseudenhygromyxa sp. WMMC2535]